TNKAGYYLRQIIGSVNYPTNSNLQDFCYGRMTFQIEHHLWPSASVYQCKKLRPKLIEICKKYEIPYREEPLGKRVNKLLNAITLPEGGEIELSTLGVIKC
ncbi:MAG: fatty acid desaturase, partial [Bacteriovoracaceae bacterium]|nr:fatty acid desaturase [Bacteriovoracaceae bacterium]